MVGGRARHRFSFGLVAAGFVVGLYCELWADVIIV